MKFKETEINNYSIKSDRVETKLMMHLSKHPKKIRKLNKSDKKLNLQSINRKKILSKAISKYLELTTEFCDNLHPYLLEHSSDFLHAWNIYLDSIKELKTHCSGESNKA
ncbi:hypothetical protein [Leptospira santarosai]|uniref:hypothetical protein n=1 Tax=Leptospira santarosai TaxID=28183 RepID=UPI0024AEED1F|nr:hypothetical protein [Leptospira santarosai]MDI7165958.1 hypothetical protein [Leptospira santarosai]